MLTDPIKRILFKSNIKIGKFKIVFLVPVLVNYDGLDIYIEDIFTEELFIRESPDSLKDEILSKKIIDLLVEGLFNDEIKDFCLDYY